MTLNAILSAISSDPGLKSSIPASHVAKGVEAASELNRILLEVIDQTGVNDDRVISAGDMQAISDALWLPRNAQLWREFWLAHGNDNGTVETGYHWVQDDGATRLFQGRNFVDTVADAFYHFGFRITGGRYANEDGNENERIADCAGWLNYFLNGYTIVYGGAGDDNLHSGTYSEVFAKARNEQFRAGGGNDRIWADLGNDTVFAGAGNDETGGGKGNDRLCGEDGRDRLMGEAGNDELFGGSGNDSVWAGDGADRIFGELGNDVISGDDEADLMDGGLGADTLYGGAGADRMLGNAGDDDMNGGGGNDTMQGGDGRDTIYGADHADRISGGAGADFIQLWERVSAADVIVLAPGDSGRTAGTIDRVEGFRPGTDRFDLTAFDDMRFARGDFTGGGHGSCYYDGKQLRIDVDGDRATDMVVTLAWVDDLAARDFIFA